MPSLRLFHCVVSALVLGLHGWTLGTTVTNDSSVAAEKSFDYIVAGAGLSGLVVGNKLSGKGFSVLVIEAGPNASWNPEVFDAEGRKFGSETCNWKYPAYGDDGKPLSWKVDAGACIGGGTSSELLVFVPRPLRLTRFSQWHGVVPTNKGRVG
jgi:choline dehydrogenase